MRPTRVLAAGQSPNFLADIMVRIDRINSQTAALKKAALARPRAGTQAAAKQTPAAPRKTHQKTARPQKTGQARPAQGSTVTGQQAPAFAAKTSQIRLPPKTQTRIRIKDHPMSDNIFKLMDEKNFQANRGKRNFAPRSGQPQSRQQGSRDGKKPVPQKARKAGSAFNKRPAVAVVPAAAPVVATPEPLRPALLGESFFYGKPASLGVSALSRVAAVAKHTLLASRYPYKLPLLIVAQLDPSYTGNRFVLQQDFSLDVDQAAFEAKIKTVVKGEADVLETGGAVSQSNRPVHDGVLCSAMPLAAKQSVFDLVTGRTTVGEVLKTAAWK